MRSDWRLERPLSGCRVDRVWLARRAVYQGESHEYALSFTSSTRSMPPLMRESTTVRGAFRVLAKFALAGNVEVTNEWHEISVV